MTCQSQRDMTMLLGSCPNEPSKARSESSSCIFPGQNFQECTTT